MQVHRATRSSSVIVSVCPRRIPHASRSLARKVRPPKVISRSVRVGLRFIPIVRRRLGSPPPSSASGMTSTPPAGSPSCRSRPGCVASCGPPACCVRGHRARTQGRAVARRSAASANWRLRRRRALSGEQAYQEAVGGRWRGVGSGRGPCRRLGSGAPSKARGYGSGSRVTLYRLQKSIGSASVAQVLIWLLSLAVAQRRMIAARPASPSVRAVTI